VDHLSPHSSWTTLELPENELSHGAESLLSPKSATAKRKARTVASPPGLSISAEVLDRKANVGLAPARSVCGVEQKAEANTSTGFENGNSRP